MGSRRHILPAIYNANLELFHWTPPPAISAEAAIAAEPAVAAEPAIAAEAAIVEVKQEPIADLIWMNGQTIDILDDSEDELELENGKKLYS